MWSGIGRWFGRMARRKGIAHLVRAFERFTARLGFQFSGALTYFSFLAVVPIAMVSFSIAGFVLASQPSLLTSLQSSITSLLPGSLATSIRGLLEEAINARLTVGVIGLVVAVYSGVSWMGNLRSAIQAMWRPDFDTDQEIAAETLWGYYLKSLGYLAALTTGILLSLALTTIGTSAQSVVLRWAGVEDVSGLQPFFTIVPLLLAVGADMVIFVVVYRVLPPKAYPAPRPALIRGAIAAAVAFEILKFGLTYILPTLLKSATARIFGPVIGLLIFFNLAATVVLFIAAWIATASGSRAAHTPKPFVRTRQGAKNHPQPAISEALLPAATLAELDEFAEADGTTRDGLVRAAVSHYLADRQRAKAAGAEDANAGAADAGQTDKGDTGVSTADAGQTDTPPSGRPEADEPSSAHHG